MFGTPDIDSDNRGLQVVITSQFQLTCADMTVFWHMMGKRGQGGCEITSNNIHQAPYQKLKPFNLL